MIHILDLNFLGKPNTIASFLVETLDGPVLIETGPYSTFPTLEKKLKEKGYSVKDVKHVLLTHIHLDHAGAAWAFAEEGATIYVHPKGAKHLADPAALYESAKRLYNGEMDKLWGELRPISRKQIVSVKHKEKVKAGKTKFKAFHTPGHASHHIAWKLDNELFAGDVAGVRIQNGIAFPPCSPPEVNVEDWKASIRMLLEMRFDKLYLTHFGAVDDVKPHLIELRARLVNWANWMKPLLDNNMPEEEILSKFEEYVETQLKAAGATDSQIQMYKNAAPSWMSMQGLKLYWEKMPKPVLSGKKG